MDARMMQVAERPGQSDMNQLNAALEREEKVQKHIDDNNLPPHEAAAFVFANGSTNQKVATVQHLVSTVLKCSADEALGVVKIIGDNMMYEDEELQVAAPPSLALILTEDGQASGNSSPTSRSGFILPTSANVVGESLPGFRAGSPSSPVFGAPFRPYKAEWPVRPTVLGQPAVQAILNVTAKMLDAHSESVREAWSKLALAVSCHVGIPDLESTVIPLALKKSEHSEPHDQRLLACGLIGALSLRLDPAVFQQKVLPKALALCQDTDTKVRAAMALQLNNVARALGHDVTTSKVAPELFEQLNDEEGLVASSAFAALVDLIDYFDTTYRREHVLPLVRSHLASPSNDSLRSMASEFGRFVWKIKADIDANDANLFGKFFSSSARKSDAELRRLCAFNLPAVVDALPSSVVAGAIVNAIGSLATDSSPPTRRAVSAGFHEVVRLVEPSVLPDLKSALLAMLADPEIPVRHLIFGHLSEILDRYHDALQGDSHSAFFAQVLPHVLSYESAVHQSRDKMVIVLRVISRAHEFFTPGELHTTFARMLYRHLTEGVRSLRPTVAGLLFAQSRHFTSQSAQVELMTKVLEDFARGKSCVRRAAFPAIFIEAEKHYSRKFVRELMLTTLAGLATDEISNVRIALAAALPAARRVLRGGEATGEPQAAFGSCVDKLHTDTVQEVVEAVVAVQPELSDIESHFASLSMMRVADPSDTLDQEREREEKDLLDVTKEQERKERRAKLRELLNQQNETDLLAAPVGGAGPGGAGARSGSSRKRPGAGARATPVGGTGHTRGAGSSSTTLPKVSTHGRSSSGTSLARGLPRR